MRDFPAGSGRYVVDADGYVATIVNGEVLLADGTWTGSTPGRILRGGRADAAGVILSAVRGYVPASVVARSMS